MEEIVKTIQTRKGGTVSLIKPDNGLPFFRYLAGAVATTDSFRYVIRQHGQEDIATVNIEVNHDQNNQPDDQKAFNNELAGFLKCVETFMDGSPATMALTNLLGIDEGDVLNDDWMQQIFVNFKYLDYAREGGVIEFQEHLGIYHYNAKDGFWEFESGGKAVILRFPSSPESKGNDGEWRINHLKTIPTKTEDGLYHLPVSMETQLSIEGKNLLGLRIHEINYFENTAIPTFINLEAMARPYVLEVNLESKDQREFAIRGSISDGDGCHLGIETTWMVNQDLREGLREEHLHMLKGDVHLNEITFTNLHSLFEATKADINDQATLDKMLNVQCLLKGRKIGDVRYLINEEIVEMTYLDGTRQNISDIVVNFFKKYFEEDKPTGEVRNNAFNMAAPMTHRELARPTLSMGDVKAKTTSNLAQAVRRRTIRNTENFSSLAKGLSTLFKEEESSAQPGDEYIKSPDYPGAFTTIPDYGMAEHDLVYPGIIEHKIPLVTPEDKPPITVKTKVTKAPEIVPPKVSKAPAIKPDKGISKVIDSGVKPAIKPAAIPPKSATIKPKAASAIKPAPAKVKPAVAAKPQAPVKKAPVTKTKSKVAAEPVPGSKTKAVAKPAAPPKITPKAATIKPVEGIDKVAAKPIPTKRNIKPK